MYRINGMSSLISNMLRQIVRTDYKGDMTIKVEYIRINRVKEKYTIEANVNVDNVKTVCCINFKCVVRDNVVKKVIQRRGNGERINVYKCNDLLVNLVHNINNGAYDRRVLKSFLKICGYNTIEVKESIGELNKNIIYKINQNISNMKSVYFGHYTDHDAREVLTLEKELEFDISNIVIDNIRDKGEYEVKGILNKIYRHL